MERSIGALLPPSSSFLLTSLFPSRKNKKSRNERLTAMVSKSSQSKMRGPGGAAVAAAAARTVAASPDARVPRGSSRFTGVYWSKTTKKWQAALHVPGEKKQHYLGVFASEDAAARARDAEVRRRNLPTARLNFPAEGEATATELAALASSTDADAAAAAAPQQQQRKRQRTPSPSPPPPRSPRESPPPPPGPGRGTSGGGGGGAPRPVPEGAGGLAPLTLEAILELAGEPDPGVRRASLIQAIGRLEVDARAIARKRGDAKRAALAADESRDRAREAATQQEAAVLDLLREAEDAARMARGAAERAESLKVAAAGARRAADERAQLAARAEEDAERAKRAYEGALGMHDRAFEVARRARTSFAAAAAEIEEKKAKVFELLGVPGGT